MVHVNYISISLGDKVLKKIKRFLLELINLARLQDIRSICKTNCICTIKWTIGKKHLQEHQKQEKSMGKFNKYVSDLYTETKYCWENLNFKLNFILNYKEKY